MRGFRGIWGLGPHVEKCERTGLRDLRDMGEPLFAPSTQGARSDCATRSLLHVPHRPFRPLPPHPPRVPDGTGTGGEGGSKEEERARGGRGETGQPGTRRLKNEHNAVRTPLRPAPLYRRAPARAHAITVPMCSPNCADPLVFVCAVFAKDGADQSTARASSTSSAS
eukprot:1226849-Prymnesium_polylepis.1